METPNKSVSVGPVSSAGPIYPCAVSARVGDALVLVGALDGGAVVVMRGEADFAGHAVSDAQVGGLGHSIVGSVLERC